MSLMKSFEDTSDRQIQSVAIKQSLRLSTAVPGDLPRVVPEGGTFVCGHCVPGEHFSTKILDYQPMLNAI